jgi:hypothetical protein
MYICAAVVYVDVESRNDVSTAFRMGGKKMRGMTEVISRGGGMVLCVYLKHLLTILETVLHMSACVSFS